MCSVVFYRAFESDIVVIGISGDVAPAVLSRLNWSLAQKEDQTMKRKRFTEEQIIGVLREHDLGAKTCRKHGISEATFYNWKSKFGGLDVSEARRLKQLEGENARLKKLLADSMLDNVALKDLLSKNW